MKIPSFPAAFLLTAITNRIQIAAGRITPDVHNITSDIEKIDLQFKNFVIEFNKTYVDDPREYSRRKEIFKESLIRHSEINQREKELGGKALYGVNQFSDWTPQEFKEFLKIGLKRPQQWNAVFQNSMTYDQNCTTPKFKDLPKYWDWNKQGKVTAIKNQGKCGSCWAFTATECIESQWAIAGHPLQELSVQEFISCSRPDGCSGGNTYAAMDWLSSNNYTLAPASEYPYMDASTACRSSVLNKPGARTKEPCALYHANEFLVLQPTIALKGPVAVNVDATLWHDYIEGIIQHHCTSTDINHAVQITGYDVTGEVPYWIVRNSWGTQFGKDGYLFIKMGDNLCGLAGSPSYAVV